MNLLVRVTDETSDYIYKYFKEINEQKLRVSAPLSEYAEAYCEAYERALKRINETDYPRIID